MPTKCFELLDLLKLRSVKEKIFFLGNRKRIDALLCAVFVLYSYSAMGSEEVKIKTKTLKEASHLELSGPKDWHYEVVRKDVGGASQIDIQFKGVAVDKVQALENYRDNRIQKIVVKEGINKDALVEFYLSPKMNFFEYQTDSPVALVLDVYPDALPAKKIKVVEKPKLSDFVQKKKGAKRGVASLDRIQLGDQPEFAKPGTESSDPASFNVLDLADRDNKRLQLNTSEIKEEALIRSEREIYLAFPEHIKRIQPTLLDIENNKTTFEVEKTKDEENQIVRLILKLFNEEKYAMALKTYKFLEDRYPKTKYAEMLHLLKAEIYYRLWKRDNKETDLETAMGAYQEHLLRYPETSVKQKLTYFLGMIYFERGQYLKSLNHFQTAVKENKESPYYWSMRMAVAESYRYLKQQESALQELGSIEQEAISKEISQQAKFRRGDVYFKMSQYDEAISEYAKAIKAYPENTQDSSSAYYNTAESYFRKKDYKKAMEQYLLFVKKFPDHEFGGYALNRVGSILEITGAPENKTIGAYLESFYRFKGSPGAFVSKLKINLMRYEKMKPKEVETFVKESMELMPSKDIEDIESLVKITLSDGYLKRHDYNRSMEILTRYYKEKLRSPYLSLVRNRIYKTLTDEIKYEFDQSKNMNVIQTYLKNKDNWLKENPRVDTEYILAQAYEKLNLLEMAEKFYTATDKKLNALSKEEEKRRGIFEHHFTADQLKLRLAKVSLMQDAVKKSAQYISQIKNPQLLNKEEKVELSLITAANAEKEAKYDVALAQLKNLTDSWKGKNNLLIEPWLRISKIYQTQKKLDEAIKWTDQIEAVITSTKNPTEEFKAELIEEALQYAAELNYEAGKINKSIQIYKQLIEKYLDAKSPHASIKYKLGKIYFDQNNLKEAEKIWGQLMTDNKDNLWSKMAEENLKQLKWANKFKRYVGRRPASQSEEKNDTNK